MFLGIHTQTVPYVPTQGTPYALTKSTPHGVAHVPPPPPNVSTEYQFPPVSKQQQLPTQVVLPQTKSVHPPVQQFQQQPPPLQQYQSESGHQHVYQQQSITSTSSMPPHQYNISPLAGNETKIPPTTLSAMPVVPHWFYFKDSSQWIPFSYFDSNNLESTFRDLSTKTSISTDGGRYDVDLSKMQRCAAYWSEAPCEVRRCTWYFKERGGRKICSL